MTESQICAERRPYAPAANVVGCIQFYRSNPDLPYFDASVMAMAGVPESARHLVRDTMAFLDLVTVHGQVTDRLSNLASQKYEESYRAALEEAVRRAYAEDFALVDPSRDSTDAMNAHFSRYVPASATERMRSLFTGLCAAAGMPIQGVTRRTWTQDVFRQAFPVGAPPAWTNALYRPEHKVWGDTLANLNGTPFFDHRITVPFSQADVRCLDQSTFREFWDALGKMIYARALAELGEDGDLDIEESVTKPPVVFKT